MTVVIVGPVPPPHHGVATATRHVIREVESLGRLAAHLDTSDRRSLDNVGRFDFENVRLALLHAFRLASLLHRHRNADLYLPISQSRWGFIRDVVLVTLARCFRRRVYGHLHGGSFRQFHEESSRVMQFVIRRTLEEIDQVWVLTPRLRSTVAGIVPPERVRIVENVVDDVPATSRPVSPSNGKLRILFLGNLIPGKGAEHLLAAIEHLGPAAAQWKVRLVGELHDSMRGQIEPSVERVRQRGIDVELTGAKTGAAKLAELHAADMFVYPSTYREEGQPLVLLEAMASGLPIVTTRHAGIPDTLRDGVDGVLVNPGSTDELGAALQRVAADTSLRATLAKAARRRYEDCYTPSRLRRDLATLLDE